jgi:hypothetical protein
VREDLLRGVLGADLVGFQTASYARHFRWVFCLFKVSIMYDGGLSVPFLLSGFFSTQHIDSFAFFRLFFSLVVSLLDLLQGDVN